MGCLYPTMKIFCMVKLAFIVLLTQIAINVTPKLAKFTLQKSLLRTIFLL